MRKGEGRREAGKGKVDSDGQLEQRRRLAHAGSAWIEREGKGKNRERDLKDRERAMKEGIKRGRSGKERGGGSRHPPQWCVKVWPMDDDDDERLAHSR